MNVNDFSALIAEFLPEPEASLLTGILFGAKTGLPENFYQSLVISGTLHVTALSGMNISIITRLTYQVFTIFGRIPATLLTILSVSAFVFFVGPSPSLLRAAIMGYLTILAVAFGRKDIPLLTLFLAAITILFKNPKLIESISFQLSFLATLGIILLASETVTPKAFSARQKLLRSLWFDLKVTLAAQLFTLPVIFYHFRRISLISPVANLLIGWLIAPLTYLGFLLVFSAWLFKPLGFFMTFLVWPLLSFFVLTVEFLSKLPLASLNFP